MGCKSRKHNLDFSNLSSLQSSLGCRGWRLVPAVLVISVLFLTWISDSASAAIKCRGMFQIIKGHGLISTPYCQDKWLASYVKRYGVIVSFETIRKNPAKKDEICRFLRHDPQIRSVCGVLSDDDFSPRRF